MEEAKAAAYYDELSRKGEGAARFKQGLGFSTTSTNRNDVVPSKGSSSFLRSFVKASSTTKTAESDNKQSDLETIQNKLKKKPLESSRVSTERDRESHSRRRSRSRSRDRHGSRHRRRSSSRDRDRNRDRDRYVERERGRERRSRSRSGSASDEDRRRRRDRRSEKNVGIDYGKLIQGYHKMSPAERVKAKMKLQLSETAEKDETKGVGSGWERFEFNKDAPLDDEEIEAVEDDVALVKHIGQSFRFSAVEARREEQIKAAHDKAMFGASSIPPSVNNKDEIEQENNKNENKENAAATTLISDKIIAKQQGSWRDRARKV